MRFLTGSKPGEGLYKDCGTWAELRHKAARRDDNSVAKIIASMIFGWAIIQYAAFTVSGVDAPYWWDVLVYFVIPSRLTAMALGASLAYRVYGGIVPLVSLFGSL